MNQLIEIRKESIDGETVQTVDARDLHAFLEVKSEFRNWIKNRIDDFGFVEGQDFVTTVNIYRGGERKDYHLALDMAKELSMVERNEKGKQARQYFIECERIAKAATVPSLGQPQKLVGELAIMECYTRLLRPAASSQVAMLAHIAKSHDLDATFLPAYTVDAASDAAGGTSMPTKALTDLLQEHGVGYSARAYNQLLKDAGVLTQLTRKTTGGVKSFWSITDAGLKYGKNITSPTSPRETQPHWYVDRFAELHDLVVSRMERREAA